jgi:hypothetical protein
MDPDARGRPTGRLIYAADRRFERVETLNPK